MGEHLPGDPNCYDEQMQALLITIGSHGDVHPFIGLGIKLRERGHRVTIVANDHFRSLIDRAGLEHLPLDTEQRFLDAIKNPDIWHPRKGLNVIINWGLLPLLRPVYEIVRQHCVPGETVVAASTLALGARIAQEKLGVPLATVHLSPVAFRSAIDPPKIPGLLLPMWAPSWLFKLFFWLADRSVIDPAIAPGLNGFRAELGLPPVQRFFHEWQHSPQLVLGMFPQWFAPPQLDWPPQAKLVGFPLFDETQFTPLPSELEAFLRAGEKPIAFTPGSANVHGREFFDAAVRLCTQLNRRGILLTRHIDQLPRGLPSFVQHFPYAPFSQLLPRCAALVHHGGIGTTSQALHARIPQLITALSYDQFDNARRVERLGCGKATTSRRFASPRGADDVSKVLAMNVPHFQFDDALTRSCEEMEQLFKSARPKVGSNPSAAL